MTNQETPRNRLYQLLGDLPERHRPISCTTLSIEERPAYVLETLILDLNGIEPVPAYFVRPHGPGPWPVVLYNHAHGGDYTIGKEELLSGRGAIQKPAYGAALAGAGYAALCFDTWAFGERRGRTE